MTVIADPQVLVQFKATGPREVHHGLRRGQSGTGQPDGELRGPGDAEQSTKAQVKIGDQVVDASSPNFAKALPAAIKAHGYPPRADPAEINY